MAETGQRRVVLKLSGEAFADPELNYRTNVGVKGGLPAKLREGLKKYCPRLQRHTLHKLKRK